MNRESEVKEDDPLKKQLGAMQLRENLYERINISLKTMNFVIAILVIAIIVFVTFGVWQAQIR